MRLGADVLWSGCKHPAKGLVFRGVLRTNLIVYPDGDSQEIEHTLRVNELVDLNGNPLPVPLPTERMIVYRVWKISTNAERHTEQTYFHLELVRNPELRGLAEGRT